MVKIIINMTSIIGTLKETSLHAQLKQLYAQPGDLLETNIGNSIIDIVRGDLLIEVQTGNFSALRGKLFAHLDHRPVRVIYPIAITKSILRIASNGELLTRRRSPQKGRVEMIFTELIRIPGYVKHPNFSLEVAFIEEEVVWIDNGLGSWRRGGWSIADRRLIKLIDHRIFKKPIDYALLLPGSLNSMFTSRDLSKELSLRKSLANKMLYSLNAMEMVELVGKSGRYNLYSQVHQ